MFADEIIFAYICKGNSEHVHLNIDTSGNEEHGHIRKWNIEIFYWFSIFVAARGSTELYSSVNLLVLSHLNKCKKNKQNVVVH